MEAGLRRIAVIGSGVAGLTAAYLLRRAGAVTLYEADDRLGGHAHTHEVPDAGRAVAVDSGFIVHNRRTYPLLCRMFDELGVATRTTGMSMSVRCDGCGLEYCGARGLSGLFAQPANAVNPRFLGLLTQVRRFHARARELVEQPEDLRPLGRFLHDHRFGWYFVRHFVVPLVSAVWSCGPHRVMDYPARYLFTFLAHHGMLSVRGSPTWRTVTGGSRAYVDLIAKRVADVRLLTPVRAVTRHAGTVEVRNAADEVSDFDAVVIAGHADQALGMLADPTPAEREVLGEFEYSVNHTVLHTDTSLLPRRARARGSWNYRLPSCDPAAGAAHVSYDMNNLQGIDSETGFVVTLGGGARPETVVAEMAYRHPVYTARALAAQQRLPELNSGTTAFAGAYHGWGFHEDGCRAGVRAAQSLGATW
ncbi:MAG: NAD(P)/FAD-dependent oxidoreductase [Stackebrandtia sp.]